MTVSMGLAGVYPLLAAAERKAEFAAARIAGLRRRQVVWMALLESWVVAVGLLLGALAAAGTIAGIASAVGLVSVPWAVLGRGGSVPRRRRDERVDQPLGHPRRSGDIDRRARVS